MNILVVGGGTGGHVVPVLAVSAALKKRGAQVLVVGSRNGRDETLVKEAGFDFVGIRTGKLRRYFSLTNLVDPFRVVAGFFQSLRIIRRFRPAVVFAKGGYVSLPVAWAAKLGRVPVVIHESDAVPGLANRLSEKAAKVIAVSFPPEQMAGLPKRKLVQTGNPLRDDVLKGKAERAVRTFGLAKDVPLVVVLGGSQGSAALNQAAWEALPKLLEVCQVVHQVGAKSAKEVSDKQQALPPELADRYQARGYFGTELFDLYAACDLVVSRAGAGAIAEIAAVGKPAVLVPLASAAGNHQQANAKVYEKSGAALVLDQDQLSAAALTRLVKQLLGDSQRRVTMGRAARNLARLDATDQVADLVWEQGKDHG